MARDRFGGPASFPKGSRNRNSKSTKGCCIGRSYKEFEAFMGKNPDTAVVQMDSVIGTIGGKCLLTIHFVEFFLMLAFCGMPTRHSP